MVLDRKSLPELFDCRVGGFAVAHYTVEPRLARFEIHGYGFGGEMMHGIRTRCGFGDWDLDRYLFAGRS
jgi:hypothetical protein